MDYEPPTPPDEQPEQPVPPEQPRSEPPPEDPNPRRGGARARHERRKQNQHAKPSVAPRQIRPPTQFTMPKIRIPRGSGLVLGIVGAIAFVVLVVYVLGQLRNNGPEIEPNALWLGTEWTYETRTDDQVAALVQKLHDEKIGTVYAWVSWYKYDGTWNASDQFDNVKAFVTQFKTAYPESKLYGWVSVPVQDDTGAARADYATLAQPVADFSKQIMDDFGFDGIFLNVENVWDGDQNFLALLRAVRSTVGMDTSISAAIPPDWSPSNSNIPLPPLMEPGTEWAKDYKQSVALLVDQMAVMAYNSSLSSTSDYAQWVAYQVKTFAITIAELSTSTDLVIGIPTFGAAPPGHDPAVENINSAVEGVKEGLQQAGDAARYVSGLAIYAEWETDDTEWSDFQTAWLSTQ